MKIDNKPMLRSMFREILRGLKKVQKHVPSLSENANSSSQFKKEVVKVSIDKLQYRDYLVSEIRHSAFQKFSSQPPKNIRDHAWYSRLRQGQSLIEHLKAIDECNANANANSNADVDADANADHAWNHLVEFVIEERNSQLRKSIWALDYKTHKQSIDEGRLKELHTLQAKRVVSRRNRMQQKSKWVSDKEFKAKLAENKENAWWVVRNYLKRLQLTGKIPNPYKLPYVSRNMHLQALEHPKTVNIIPGSTRASVLEAAYDMTHIEAIIKPEIEYLLNKKHYLDAYQRIVNKKGPYKVQIRSTSAGIMQAHFLRSPMKDKRAMKALAIDIKKSTRAIRKQFIWNLSSSRAEGLSERKIGNGYAVRGSKGFSMDEVMYPRSYYEKLISQEADWEFLVQLEELKAKLGPAVLKDPRVVEKLKNAHQAIKQEWMDPLDAASNAIDKEIQSYFLKYKVTKDSPIWEQRKRLQVRMNKRFGIMSKKLGRLVKVLKANEVCAHSDLFHRNKNTKRRDRWNLPEEERLMAGKSLGDYLEEAGLKGYRMGYKFEKRLKIA